MAFLGIDQSLNASGVCLVSDDGTFDQGATILPGKTVGGARLLLIKNEVDSRLHGVRFAALEGYAYASVGRVFELGEVGGVIKALLTERGVPYVVVPPVLVKKFATGNTSATKDDMLIAAKERGVSLADDNQADAFFLANIARAYVQGAARRRSELEVLHSLKTSAQDKKQTRRRPRRLVKSAL